MSSRSRTHSFATCRTARSPALIAPCGIAPSRSGSTDSGDPRTTPRCSRTTGAPHSSSCGPPGATTTSWSSVRDAHSVRPGIARLRSTASPSQRHSTTTRSLSGPTTPSGLPSCSNWPLLSTDPTTRRGSRRRSKPPETHCWRSATPSERPRRSRTSRAPAGSGVSTISSGSISHVRKPSPATRSLSPRREFSRSPAAFARSQASTTKGDA